MPFDRFSRNPPSGSIVSASRWEQRHRAHLHDHKKHGAFGMDFNAELLRHHSHEIWVGVWWGILANLGLLMVVAIGIWLKQKITQARAKRRERLSKPTASKYTSPAPTPAIPQPRKPSPERKVQVERAPAEPTRAAPQTASWSSSPAVITPPTGYQSSYKPAQQDVRSSPVTAAASRMATAAAAPRTAGTVSRPDLKPAPVPAAPAAAAASSAASSFYKGAGRSIYNLQED